MPDTEFTLPRLSAADALTRAADGQLQLLDLRKPAAARASGQWIAGAEIRDPFTFGHDDPLTRSDRPIAVFCVHGHEVSRFGAAMLMLHGRTAWFIEGGFEALIAAGAPTAPVGDAQ